MDVQERITATEASLEEARNILAARLAELEEVRDAPPAPHPERIAFDTPLGSIKASLRFGGDSGGEVTADWTVEGQPLIIHMSVYELDGQWRSLSEKKVPSDSGTQLRVRIVPRHPEWPSEETSPLQDDRALVAELEDAVLGPLNAWLSERPEIAEQYIAWHRGSWRKFIEGQIEPAELSVARLEGELAYYQRRQLEGAEQDIGL